MGPSGYQSILDPCPPNPNGDNDAVFQTCLAVKSFPAPQNTLWAWRSMEHSLAWGLTSLGDEAIGSSSGIVPGQVLQHFLRALRAPRAAPPRPTANRGLPICRMGPRPRPAGKSHPLALLGPHFNKVIKIPSSQSHQANANFCDIISAIN